MSRGVLDEFMYGGRGTDPTVEVEVRIEHTTARAIQVSTDGGDTVEWVPREAIFSASRDSYGPGDTVTIEISEKLATEKGLI